MSLSIMSAQEIDKMALKMAVERQLTTYPESMLQDVYKAFYQEHFGPEHMISDTAAVSNYLEHELATMGNDDKMALYYEPIGIDGNYVRVYLKTVKDGLISTDQLLQAFIDSANSRREPAIDWTTKWDTIVDVVDKIKPEMGSDEERALLHEASIKKQAVHHSSNYNAAYHPHYRIVDRNIFELLLKPAIDR